MASNKPKQKVSEAEKTEEWYKLNADYIKEQASYYDSNRQEMVDLMRATMGYVDATDYKTLLNPYNSTDENLKHFPAQIRNVNIISPIINLFLGEKSERPFVGQVVVVNPDSSNAHKGELDKEFIGAMAQDFVNQLNASGVQTGVPTQETPEYQALVNKYKVGNNDKRALFGQEALDYIRYDLDLKDKYQDAAFDWFSIGRVYSYKDVFLDDLHYEIVSPLEMWHGTSRTGFVEDCDWAMRRSRYNLNELIDKFHKTFKDPAEIDSFEAQFSSGNTSSSISSINTIPNLDNPNNAEVFNNDNLIDVFHCVWKGFKKIGILDYTDEFGQPQSMEVDDTYVLDTTKGDIKVDWEYHSIVHEAYILGDKVYKYCRELPIQRAELCNTSVCKLPYNGRIGYSERDKISSVTKTLLPYQVLVNTYNFRLELTLARNKDKLTVIPIGLMPEGWKEDKFLYFADVTGMLFFDETKANAAAVLNSIRSIDLNLGNYISSLRDIIISIRNEAWDAVGMNRQRYGDVKASDGKGNTDQAVIRSATITRELFRRLEKFEESDGQGLLDYSKAAWINGKKASFIRSDGSQAFIEVDPEMHLNTDYGVFYKDSEEEAAKLKFAKDYAFGWAQKGTSLASVVLEVLDANNMSKLKQYVAKAEEVERQYQDGIQKAQQESAEGIAQMKAKTEAEKNATSIKVAEIQAGATIEGANIRANSDATGDGSEETDNNDELMQHYNEYVSALQDRDFEKQKLGLQALHNASQNRLKEMDLNIKREDIKSKEKIARTNKNKYDK